MRVTIRTLRKEGRLVGAAEAKAPAVAGVLTVGEKRDQVLGRAVTRAKVVGITTGSDTDLLPELLNVQLLFAADSKMRLAGVERIDNIEYSQTWAIEVLPC
ncbi:MAG: hypothetical protein V4508_19070 [Pseudomonadota bacterium]|jgi:hypothetical protein